MVATALKDPSADRWIHKFELVHDEGIRIELLKSVEGDSESNWPPSPPLQEINRHDLGSGAALLGVGMAGKSHWSSSISADNDAIIADLACLVKDPSDSANRWIGSTYQLAPSADIQVRSAEEIELALKAVSAVQVCLKTKKVGDFESMIEVNDSTIQIFNDAADGQNRWCFEFFLRTNP